ncbi:MAG TPA: hypothetical protein VFB14_17795 [Bryobacteraceae bacterium]|nr:hypothetical protein [Bryobacteraceae bacterium]
MSDAVQLQVVPVPDNTCRKPRHRLDHWSLRVSPIPHDWGGILLTGRVFGHAEFADNSEIVTSPLWLMVRTEAADLGYTNAAVYELCAAHPDLVAALLQAV